MFIHLGLHHFLDRATEQILESILYILSALYIVLFKQSANNFTFSFSHFDMMHWFLWFSGHSKRPSMN